MESVKPIAVTPSKKLARSFAKVLHLRALIGIASVDSFKNVTISEPNHKEETINLSGPFNKENKEDNKDNEEFQERVATEILLAKLFASISTIKAAYAEFQYFQTPFDPEGIQSSDQLLVSELKHLSELKQCYLKKQFDFDSSPEKAILEAESKELKGVIKTYEITAKKLESQVRLKDSEIIFLKEKLDEANRNNKSIEKKLNQSGQLFQLDNVHISGLSPSHFVTVLRHAVRSIRSFVKLIVEEMRSANWDIDAAITAIEKDVIYMKEDHKCFAIESFISKEMFDAFHLPNFSLANESLQDTKKQFFEKFNELKSTKAMDFLAMKPRSTFAKFCGFKYLRLIHPKMESSFFGNMNQRNLINAGEFPETVFFTSFAEMAKRVYLLHCLAFSFESQADIFQVKKGSRFSDVYMDCVNDEMFQTVESDPQVGFTVVPGFRIGKTVLQCQVYLSSKEKKDTKKR